MAELSVPIPAPAAANREGEESNIISVPTDDNNPADAPKIRAVRITAPSSTETDEKNNDNQRKPPIDSSKSPRGLSWLEAKLERIKFDVSTLPALYDCCIILYTLRQEQARLRTPA